MKFIDQTNIYVKAGDGGAGIASFMRSKHRPKMGPDGGDGGFGGSVYALGNIQQNTLSHLRFKSEFKAKNGEKGGNNAKTGADGDDLFIPVPLGTMFYLGESQDLIGEVVEDGQKLLLAKGGKRGLGNMRFASSTNQAPYQTTPGGIGEEANLRLELKLLADVGLAGQPNAGKSTLLSVLSAAKPKIADYPFTTLEPQLGVVEHPKEHHKPFVIADIPGLIEGAHLGKGLGHQFLKHLERTKTIALLVDTFEKTSEQLISDIQIILDELYQFSDQFKNKRMLVVFTKIEISKLSQKQKESLSVAVQDKYGFLTCFISSLTREGLNELKTTLSTTLD